MWYPQTLFARTGITIGIAFTVFLVFSGAIVISYILVPLAQRAADDVSTLMVHSVQAWVDLPPSDRPAFAKELMDNHQLKIELAGEPLPETTNPWPYLLFIENALQQQLGQPIALQEDHLATPWFYADIVMDEHTVRIGFPRSRVAARPPLAVLLLVLGSAVAILLTSLLLVRRLTQPLERLSEATSRIGRGEMHEPLPETGPKELSELTHNFNVMEQELNELIENRTTLLAGISHDLRTPLTRMRLALEMLPEDRTYSGLTSRLRHDTQEMDQLINVALEMARGTRTDDSDEIDLREFLDGIVSDYVQSGRYIDWKPQKCCLIAVNTVALQRIVMNLLDNAIRYDGSAAPAIECYCEAETAVIDILDRGPGIPENEREAVFRPFHRLETSRNRRTGGSGLGLAIARQLAEAQCWKIELLAREGGGTIAQIRIPFKHPESA